MEHKGIYVTQKDVRRYELLQKAGAGKLELRQVTEALGVSYRQALRLKAKLEAGGLGGLLHGNRGRPAPNRARRRCGRGCWSSRGNATMTSTTRTSPRCSGSRRGSPSPGRPSATGAGKRGCGPSANTSPPNIVSAGLGGKPRNDDALGRQPPPLVWRGASRLLFDGGHRPMPPPGCWLLSSARPRPPGLT